MQKLIGCSLLLLLGASELVAAEPDRAPSLQAVPTIAIVVKDELSGGEVEALFSPDADKVARAAAFKHAVKLAMEGDGLAAFDLGVLFRHGMDHPARTVERDIGTARHWLEKCVESEKCPGFALASLAELELQAGNDKAAMQWAQAWALFGKELDKAKMKSGGRAGSDAYAAYLLTRCYERLGRKNRDRDAAQWFQELLATRGKQLDHMLAYQLKSQSQENKNWTEFFARRSRMVMTTRLPDVPTIGLFLLRAAPEGGQAEAVTVIEVLPSPKKMADFPGIARRLESRPYLSTKEEPRKYGFMPIQSDDPRYGLAPSSN